MSMRQGVVAATVMLAVWAAPVRAQSADGDAIVGTWLTEDGGSKVEITRTGATYAGRVVWIKVPEGGTPPVDAKNSDASLRTRPIQGIDILSGFTFTGNKTWDGGKVYAPRRGNSYNGTLTLNADGTLSVKAKAGIGSKTVKWTRA